MSHWWRQDCLWTPLAIAAATVMRDADADGICDDIDDCVGTFDECGVCNGPAPSTTAAVLRRVIAIVMAMWPMPSACVAANVRPTRMQTLRRCG